MHLIISEHMFYTQVNDGGNLMKDANRVALVTPARGVFEDRDAIFRFGIVRR